MKTAVILHGVPDAKHCVANMLHEGNILFSTHPSVDIYLKEKHGVSCRCLSEFISIEELIDRKQVLSDSVDGLLKDLDSRISPSINSVFKLEMNYFTPLYSYLGKNHLLGYAIFMDCVKKIVGFYAIEKILFYEFRLNEYLDTSTTVGDLSGLFFGNIQTEVIKIPENAAIGKARAILRDTMMGLKKLRRCNPRFVCNKIADLRHKSKFRRFSGGRKTILMSGLLYELEFLCKYISRYNVMYYDLVKEGFVGLENDRADYSIDLDPEYDTLLKSYPDPLVRIFIKDIREDLANNISQYLNAVYSIERNNVKYPISLGIWGNSPGWKTRAMIFEYLRSKNIKIIGSQHGCLYGEMSYPWHFDLDFNRCDSFISWGFTGEDLKRTYPLKKINTEILPFGKVEMVKADKALKKIDLLFPIIINLSMFSGGMAILPPDKLIERQTVLLEYLNSLNLPDVYVKPIMGSSHLNCSALPILKRLRNLKTVDTMMLSSFLEKYSPKAVLVEYPSSPLFDVLSLDTEIFFMGDPVNPYEKTALEELKRRVHYSEDTDEIISKIGLFLQGKLEKKRDDTFFRHYMYKERTKENITSMVDALIADETVGD